MMSSGAPAGSPMNHQYQSPPLTTEFNKVQHNLGHNYIGAVNQNFGHYVQGPTYGQIQGQRDPLEQYHYPVEQGLFSSGSPTSTIKSGPQKRNRGGEGAGEPKGAKVRKEKTRKLSSKPLAEKLPGPLSELTKGLHHVEIRDMGKWVKRSLEERREENSIRVGYVTRPMNSFMLYRSAYSERCKQWCKAYCHQAVSTVAGQSWPLEPKAIRDEFAEYAKIEKENHALANPDYHFRPQKANKSKKVEVERGEWVYMQEVEVAEKVAEKVEEKKVEEEKGEEEFELPMNEEEGSSIWDLVNFEPFPVESAGWFAPKDAAEKGIPKIPKGMENRGTLEWDPFPFQSPELDSPTFGELSGISQEAELSSNDDGDMDTGEGDDYMGESLSPFLTLEDWEEFMRGVGDNLYPPY